jgi:protein-tyrosine phosphatase
VAVSKNILLKKGITHILSVIDGLLPPHPKDFVYKCVEITDVKNSNILRHFRATTKFIEEALKTKGNKVLVHCFAGRSRSASCVIAYIMKQW